MSRVLLMQCLDTVGGVLGMSLVCKNTAPAVILMFLHLAYSYSYCFWLVAG